MNQAKRKKLMILGMLNPPEVKVEETVPEPVLKVEQKVEPVLEVELKNEEPVAVPAETVPVEEEKPQKVKKFKKVLDSQEQ